MLTNEGWRTQGARALRHAAAPRFAAAAAAGAALLTAAAQEQQPITYRSSGGDCPAALPSAPTMQDALT